MQMCRWLCKGGCSVQAAIGGAALTMQNVHALTPELCTLLSNSTVVWLCRRAAGRAAGGAERRQRRVAAGRSAARLRRCYGGEPAEAVGQGRRLLGLQGVNLLCCCSDFVSGIGVDHGVRPALAQQMANGAAGWQLKVWVLGPQWTPRQVQCRLLQMS